MGLPVALACPLPQQQPCRGSHKQVALPATLGAAWQVHASPIPVLQTQSRWVPKSLVSPSDGCLSCWWAALGVGASTHGHSWVTCVTGATRVPGRLTTESGPHPQAVPRCRCVADPGVPAQLWPGLPRPAPPCQGLCGQPLARTGPCLPAPGPAPAPSGLAAAAQGTEPPASHVPRGSAAVPCLCRCQLYGACWSEEPAAAPAAHGAGPRVPPPQPAGSAAPAAAPTAAIPHGPAGSGE